VKQNDVVSLVLALCALGGCQSYEPAPLQLDEHRAVWRARSLDGASLAEFARALRERDEPDLVFDPADGLSLEEARVVALLYNADLRLARLDLAQAAAVRVEAGGWADPEFGLDLLQIQEDVPERWVATTSLTFSIPLTGRIAAEEDLAAAELTAAQYRVIEAEWSVRREVERQWIEWSAALRREAALGGLVRELHELEQAGVTLAEAGQMSHPEAGLIQLERLQRQSELDALRAELVEQQRSLQGLLGLAPDAEVVFVPTLGAMDTPGALSLDDRNPTLARLERDYAVAEERLRLAVAEQIPDLLLGPQFESDAGQPRLGFVGGIPLPIWSGNMTAIAELRGAREVARATYETTFERLDTRRAMLLGRLEVVARRRGALESRVSVLAESLRADALRLLELGEGSTALLLETVIRAYGVRESLIEVHAAEAQARGELRHLTGPGQSW